MKKTVKRLSSTKVEVTCVMEEEEWSKAIDDATVSLGKNIEIRGFRKGMAPKSLLRSRLDQNRLFNEAVDRILQDVYLQVLSEEKLEPFARPEVRISKVSLTECELVFVIILRPEVTLGTYKGFDLKKKDVLVKEEDVEAAIGKLIEENADLVLSEEPAKNGDTTIIDFLGTIDGKPFDGGKGENHPLVLGSKSFIPGFEEQLIGHKAGEEVDVKVTFPEDYVPDLAKKDAVFHVKIHEVKSKVLPKLDEELIKDLKLPNVKTPADLHAYERAKLEHEAKEKADNEFYDELIEKIAKDARMEIPSEIIDEQAAHEKERLTKQLAQQGLKLEDLLQMEKKSEEEYDTENKKQAEKALRAWLVIEKIGTVENITVPDEELEFEMARLAEQYKMPLERVKEIISKDIDRFKAEVRQRRIHDFLINENTVR